MRLGLEGLGVAGGPPGGLAFFMRTSFLVGLRAFFEPCGLSWVAERSPRRVGLAMVAPAGAHSKRGMRPPPKEKLLSTAGGMHGCISNALSIGVPEHEGRNMAPGHKNPCTPPAPHRIATLLAAR
jgi:hypothetical protein